MPQRSQVIAQLQTLLKLAEAGLIVRVGDHWELSERGKALLERRDATVH